MFFLGGPFDEILVSHSASVYVMQNYNYCNYSVVAGYVLIGLYSFLQ